MRSSALVPCSARGDDTKRYFDAILSVVTHVDGETCLSWGIFLCFGDGEILLGEDMGGHTDVFCVPSLGHQAILDAKFNVGEGQSPSKLFTFCRLRRRMRV